MSRPDVLDGDRLMTAGEVGRLFRVSGKTVTKWAVAGRIESTRTPGNHTRFRESVVRAFLEAPGPDGAAHSPPAGSGTTPGGRAR